MFASNILMQRSMSSISICGHLGNMKNSGEVRWLIKNAIFIKGKVAEIVPEAMAV